MRNRIRVTLTVIVAVMLAVGCEGEAPDWMDDAAAIRTLLDRQVAGWNAGDPAAFMAGYWESDSLRFASGGSVTRGWRETLERYRARYDTPEKMGRLTFDRIDIRLVGPDAAVVFGRWALERDGDRPWGLFTLLLRRFPEGWRIVHDHTSSGE